MAATASGTGVRVATPSTKVSASGVLTGCPGRRGGGEAFTLVSIAISQQSHSRGFGSPATLEGGPRSTDD